MSAIALTGVIAAGVTGVTPWTAVAGERTGSEVEELWRAYPLEQTDRPQLIPGPISHGCIRMRNADIVALDKRMPVGTPLTIR